MKDKANDDRDRLEWHWDGPGYFAGAIDNPVLATDYTLCVYDAGSLVMRATVDHGDPWRRTRNGFSYRLGAGNGDGIAVVRAAADIDNNTNHFTLEGKRGNLPLPGAAGPSQYFQGPVSAALVKSNAPQDYECWEASYTTVDRNDASQFEATDP